MAVKVIRDELAEDPEFRTRFAHEVAAAKRVSGVFTAPVVDENLDAAQPWLVTAYVPGPSLADAVRRYGALPAKSVYALTAGLAEGLAAIHAAGIVHRDLKPGNVLLAEDGPRVIDFGISRAAELSALTGTGLTIGTPGFMSPEQAEGREVGPPSDVFSLGAVLAFAATGEGPFGSGPTAALVYRIVNSPPKLDQIPTEIRSLVERCLIKEASKRPTPVELLKELHGVDFASGWLPRALAEEFYQHAAKTPAMSSATVAARNTASYPATLTASDVGQSPKQVTSMSPGSGDPVRITALTGLGNVNAIAFSPDARTLAIVHPVIDRTTTFNVSLWNIADLNRPIRSAIISLGPSFAGIAFSPDGGNLATAANDPAKEHRLETKDSGKLTLWDMKDPAKAGRSRTIPRFPHINNIAFSPDGLIATIGNETILWDLKHESRRPFRQSQFSKSAAVSTIDNPYSTTAAFSPDGRIVAIGSWNYSTSSGTDPNGAISLWDIGRGGQASPISVREGFGAVGGMRFSPNGQILAVLSQAKTAEIPTVRQQPDGAIIRQQPVVRHQRVGAMRNRSSKVTPGQTQLINNITLWDVSDLAFPPKLITTLDNIAKPGGAVVFSPIWNILASSGGSPSTTELWDVTDHANLIRRATLTNLLPMPVAFSPDGKTLATPGGVIGSVLLWNIG